MKIWPFQAMTAGGNEAADFLVRADVMTKVHQ